jgi:hypothetical protein
MASRGRAFAAGALLMVLAQLTAVCAVPLAACAMVPVEHRQSVECCPVGSHPPGQCPLHKNDSHQTDCRMTCARQGTTPFVPGLVGVPAPAIATAPVFDDAGSPFVVDVTRGSRTLTPSSPPPKTTA